MMDFSLIDEQLNTMVNHLELEGEHCYLKHSEADPAENHPAVDYLCQRLGDKKFKLAHQEIRIPICQECVDALYDEDWILVFCSNCTKSQWIYRPKAKLVHPPGNGVYWLDVCPYCAEIANKYEVK